MDKIIAVKRVCSGIGGNFGGREYCELNLFLIEKMSTKQLDWPIIYDLESLAKEGYLLNLRIYDDFYVKKMFLISYVQS